jgi:Phage tail sheath C-terminal domain
MALVSPGIEVSVIDESFYLPAVQGTVPLIIVASKENKTNTAGTGVAVGTLKANAGKVYLLTSQRDLGNTFGDPYFQTDSSQNPVHGGELNEYGLQAAYSYLAVNNSAYVVRADIDTNQLVSSSTAPTAYPADGTYWLDTLNSHYGIFQWNGDSSSTTGGQKFSNVIPTVITDSTQVDPETGFPSGAVGTIGSYAIVAVSTALAVYYKNYMGMWVELGSADWYSSIAAVSGSKSNPTIGIGDTFYINNIQVISSGNNLVSLKSDINQLTESHGVVADVINSRLKLFTNGNTSTNIETTASGSHTVNPTKITVGSADGIIIGMTVTDTNGHWYNQGLSQNVPGTVTDINGSVITLSHPISQNLSSVTVIFQDFYTEVNATGFIGENYISVDSITGIAVGNKAYGAGITYGAYVTSIDSDNLIVYLSTSNSAVVDGMVEFSNPNANAITLAAGTTGSGNTPIIAAAASDSVLGIAAGTYYGPELSIQPHTSVPRYKSTDLYPRPTGSVWLKTTNVNLGTFLDVKVWNSSTTSWNRVSCPVYANNQEALFKLDLAGGGKNVKTGTLYAQYNVTESVQVDGSPSYADYKIFRRTQPDPTSFVSKVIDSTTFPMGSEGFTFTGYIVGTTLHVTTLSLGTMASGQVITGTGVAGQTVITSQLTGSAGSTGTYVVSVSQNVGSSGSQETLTATTYWKKIFQFSIAETLVGSSALDVDRLIEFTADAATTDAALVAATINAAGFTNIEARVDSMNRLVIQHNTGGEIRVAAGVQAGSGQYETFDALTQLGYTAYDVNTGAGTDNLYAAPSGDTGHTFVATNWEPLLYTANSVAPNLKPTTGTLWYNSIVDQVDIMIHNGHTWVGYLDPTSPYYSNNGADFLTDPAGPLVQATKPTTQSDGTHLRTGDIWIDTSDIENYPVISIWNDYTLSWVPVDNTDHTTENGIIFADARYNTAGANSEYPGNIADLLMSNFLDFDAPDPALYPRGMLLFNTRRSGFTVKRYVENLVDTIGGSINLRFNNESMEGYYANRWVSESSTDENLVAYFGRHAQRRVVIKHLKALVDTNQEIRDDERRIFNLIACPGYVELIANMVELNIDRKQTAFVIGDTPFRLPSDATSLISYFSNEAIAVDNNEKGLVTHDDYLGVYYPSGYTTDNFGNNIVVPASHMALRTISLSDSVSYPWFAPAGLRRGIVSNATSSGYVDAKTGEFKSIALNNGQRDTLYTQNVNPITFLVGSGLTVFGQKTRAPVASALDRINVVRLIVYLRTQLSILAKPYLFEPNDKTTRDSIKAVVESLMLELVGQRALYDYLVVCDTSNNTPSRIDANELYIDIAIEPVKAIEFIYIPLRIKNTGAIAGLSKK